MFVTFNHCKFLSSVGDLSFLRQRQADFPRTPHDFREKMFFLKVTRGLRVGYSWLFVVINTFGVLYKCNVLIEIFPNCYI